MNSHVFWVNFTINKLDLSKVVKIKIKSPNFKVLTSNSNS